MSETLEQVLLPLIGVLLGGIGTLAVIYLRDIRDSMRQLFHDVHDIDRRVSRIEGRNEHAEHQT